MEFDLTSNPKLKKRWTPRFCCRPNKWKIFSGEWRVDGDSKIRCLGETRLNTAESIAIVGYTKWSDYSLKATFKILTDSQNPPEGGVIIYTHFKNFRNYYSYHFCHFKRKIELIKRYCGDWTTIADNSFDFQMGKSYEIEIEAGSNSQLSWINGQKLIEIEDADIPCGSIGIGTKYCGAEFGCIKLAMKPLQSIQKS